MVISTKVDQPTNKCTIAPARVQTDAHESTRHHVRWSTTLNNTDYRSIYNDDNRKLCVRVPAFLRRRMPKFTLIRIIAVIVARIITIIALLVIIIMLMTMAKIMVIFVIKMAIIKIIRLLMILKVLILIT